MKKSKIKKEVINMEEVRKLEIEKKEQEEIKELKKALANFSTENTMPVRTEEVLEENKKPSKKITPIKIDRIKKLKCDYELFKNERIKNKMRVPVNCELCDNPFKNNENVYLAFIENKQTKFICKKCAEG